ncbi:transglutaminase-like domain-containing protein [Occultella kanbiaonis]|uniref:transglutaminase-like domain-containing protein n=1 Tax=Occultella kanbiaonis TaxID=2675754 RepID=UPI0012BA02ED|nr:transglutaminase-like domain-containing protein [Occultella kanbiaonis]
MSTAPQTEARLPAPPPDAVARYARHSRYSDPGPHADLLRAVNPTIADVSAAARNLIAHYRGEQAQLPESTRGDIDLRWLADQLATDQARHGLPLSAPRALPERLQGCCRDHSLFSVGVLREHGVPARTRIGFADYFRAGFHHDHVVVEVFDGGRWVRFDPELDVGYAPGFRPTFDVTDIPTGLGTPFETAAQVWLAHRAGTIDADTYGVDPTLPLRGPVFVAEYVVFEAAHRHRDELLLWDIWGLLSEGPPPGDVDGLAPFLDRIDRVASLLVAADEEEANGVHGGPAAVELEELYRTETLLHPGTEIHTADPFHPDAPLRVTALR